MSPSGTACLLVVLLSAPGAGVTRPWSGAHSSAPELFRHVAEAPTVLAAPDTAQWQIGGRVLATAKLGDTLIVGGDFGSIYLPTGAGFVINNRTGEIHKPLTTVGGINAIVYASAPDPDGGWYIGGAFSSVGGQARGNIAHVSSEGRVVPWSPSVNGDVRAIAVLRNAVYIGGYFTEVNGTPRRNLAALDASTGDLLPWAPEPDGPVNALLEEQNLLFVGGAFNSIGGRAQPWLATLDPATGLATTWNPAVSSWVTCLAASGNTIYLGGFFSAVGGQIRHFAAAVDATTGSCTEWNPDVVQNPYEMFCGQDIVAAMAVVDTIVYVGGYFSAIGGQPRGSVAAVSARTGLALDWRAQLSGSGGLCAYPAVYALAASGGRVAIGGNFVHNWSNPRTNMLIVDASTGVPVDWSTGTDLGITTLTVSGDGLFVGGACRQMWLMRRGLAAFDLRTGMPTTWNPDPRAPVRALAADRARASVYVGGSFSSIGYGTNANLAAIHSVRGYLLPFPSANGEVDALGYDGTTLYVGGAFTEMGDPPQPRSRLAAVRVEDGTLLDWNPSADGSVRTIACGGAGVFVGGEFLQVGSAPRSHLAELSAATGRASDWRPDPNGAVHALVVGTNDVFAGGEFTTICAQSRPHLAALDSRTGVLRGFAPAPDGPVRALGLAGKALFVGGSFQSIGGGKHSSLAALQSASGIEVPWAADADGDVLALQPLSNGVAVGGEFTSVAGDAQRGLSFVLTGDVGAVSVPTLVPPSGVTLARASPDPGRGHVRFRFWLGEPQVVSLHVFDVQGRLVRLVLDRGHRVAGGHDVDIDTRNWAPGVYLCRLSTSSGTARVQRFTVLR